MAQEQWKDLYFRHNFDDKGLFPTAGSLSSSPDIIAAGGNPYTDPNQLIADANWGVDYGSSAASTEPNYIYLRGQNLGDKKTEGQLYLYASKASLLLYPTNPVDPSAGWSQNPIKTSNGDNSVTVNPDGGQKFVSSEPFQWIPNPIFGDHYCLVGRVVTKANPNEIPTVGNLNDFAAYISAHPNMAWRNIAVQNASSTQWVSPPIEYNQGAIGGEVYVFLKCVNAPDGSRVRFSSGTPGPNPPFAIDWTPVKNIPGKDGAPTFIAPLSTTIPANWHSNIVYTWDAANTVQIPNMTISLEALLPVASGKTVWDSSLERFAVPLEELYGMSIPLASWVGGSRRVGPTPAIALGSHAMKGSEANSGGNAGPRLSAARTEATGQTSSVFFIGTTWRTRTRSIAGSSSSDTDVTLQRSLDSKNVVTETLRITARPSGDVDADLSFDVDLNEPQTGGTTLFTLVTNNVPVNATIWFKNVGGTIPIETPPTKVTKEHDFQIATLAEIPGDYRTSIRVSLDLGGLTLPAGYTMTLTAILKTDPVAAAAELAGGGPSPGVVLGKVSVAG